MITILGDAYNYSIDECKYYLNSLKQIDFQGELVLFSSTLKPRNIRKYKFCKIVKKPLKYNNLTFDENILRYYYFSDYIKENVNHNGKILFTDIRDTIFQNNNIFNTEMEKGIYFFRENKNNFIYTEDWHKIWYENIDRKDMLDPNSKKKFIYCAGIHLFKNKGYAIKYCDLFKQKVTNYKKYKWNLVDQPVHQMVIYEDKINSKKLLFNENNEFVFHMGLCDEKEYSINEQEYEAKNYSLKNKKYSKTKICLKKSVPSIIHQYDRRDRATDLIKKLYS
jgi:hypothetical protein